MTRVGDSIPVGGVEQYDVAWLKLATPRVDESDGGAEVEKEMGERARNGFRWLNGRKLIPSPASTVRAAGFPVYGRYGAQYGADGNDVDFGSGRRYTGRQTDLAVSNDPQHTCGGHNETTQICLGFGERGYYENGVPEERQTHPSIINSCYPR